MLQFLENLTAGGLVGFAIGCIGLLWAMQPEALGAQALEIKEERSAMHNARLRGTVISVHNTLPVEIDRARVECAFVDNGGARRHAVTVEYTKIEPGERFYDEVFWKNPKGDTSVDCAVVEATRTSDLTTYLRGGL